ncbi:MAG: cytochrome ubiquinol oxidase subunit I [Alphaproteobacteria bacterium]
MTLRTRDVLWALALAAVVVVAPELAAAEAGKQAAGAYPSVGFSSRKIVWGLAQMHLFLGAFVLAVPFFVLCIEFAGVATKDERYDAMAHEFMRISLAAYSFTALVGGALTLALFLLYPNVMGYMMKVFRGQTLVYALAFLLETAFLYIYYYSWKALRYGNRKWFHLTIGLMLNAVGLLILFIANAWASFMMSPTGVDPATGAVIGSIWDATRNPLWNPLNLHRFLANIAYGGAIVGAYAAYRFLSSTNARDRAHYDWMGYTSNIIAVVAFLPLPFAGYWLMAEIYAYSQQMGITAMGGILAWLFIIQAVLIGTILFGANYYLWCGLGRTERGAAYAKNVKWIALVLVAGFLVWMTPHSLILTPAEVRELGGTHHRILGPLGIMPAKNIAVNLMLVFTFLSFQMFYRSSREPTVGWAKAGNTVILALYLVGCANIVLAGVYGYLTPTVYKVGASVPQVFSTLSIIVFVGVIDYFMLRGAKKTKVNWGRMSARSQYALFVLPIAFTWLMALMGYIRSSLRTHWHIYTIMKDKSPEAYIPTIGEAGNTITIITLVFMALVLFIFWISRIGTIEQPDPSKKTARTGAGVQ